MSIFKRIFLGQNTLDTASISNIIYNNAAGVRKSSDFGKNLCPLNTGAGTFTTDATTIRTLSGLGKNLAVFNSDTALHSVTLGLDASRTSLAAGATDVDKSIGFPCPPGVWTYIAAFDRQFVISDSNKLFIFLINDDTSIKIEASK